MANWSTEQLKEFFEMKSVEQDRRLAKLEKSIDTISDSISAIGVKVNTMWAAIGAIGLAVIASAIKILGGGQ